MKLAPSGLNPPYFVLPAFLFVESHGGGNSVTPGERVRRRRERVRRRRWSPSLLPTGEDATPEGDPHVLRSHVRCAPLTSGFVVCIANLMSEELLPRRALDLGQVCVIVSACTQARWCRSRVVHAYCKPASRGSMASQLATLLALIATTAGASCG